MSPRFNRREALQLLAGGSAGLWALACQDSGGGAPKSAAEKEDPEPETEQVKPEKGSASKPSGEGDSSAKAAPTKGPVEVKLQVGDTIAFNTKKIEVPAGSTVNLSIEHTGQMKKSAMGHNFVLLKAGVDMAAFASAAMGATDNEYIPEKMSDQVIAHTKVVGGGESDSISFPAPKKGEYQFLCSFPGHYFQMNGKFIVT